MGRVEERLAERRKEQNRSVYENIMRPLEESGTGQLSPSVSSTDSSHIRGSRGSAAATPFVQGNQGRVERRLTERRKEQNRGTQQGNVNTGFARSGKTRDAYDSGVRSSYANRSALRVDLGEGELYDKFDQVVAGINGGYDWIQASKKELAALERAFYADPTEENLEAYNSRYALYQEDVGKYQDLVEKYKYMTSPEGIQKLRVLAQSTERIIDRHMVKTERYEALAPEYVDEMQPYLKKRDYYRELLQALAPEPAQKDDAEVGILEQVGYTAGGTAANFMSGIGSPVVAIARLMEIPDDILYAITKDEQFNLDAMPGGRNSTALQENDPFAKAAEDAKKKTGEFGDLVVDLGQSAGSMMAWSGLMGGAFQNAKATPASAADDAASALGKTARGRAADAVIGAGKAVGNEIVNNPGNFGISLGSAIDSYSNALKNGASVDQALANGLAKGSAEYFSNKLFSGTPFEDSAEEKGYVTKLTEHIANRIGKSEALQGFNASTKGRVINWIFDKSGEGFEEVTTGILDPLIDRLTYDPDADLATADALVDEFLGGVLLSVGLGGAESGISKAGNAVTTYNSGKYLNSLSLSQGDIQAFIDEGLACDPSTQAYKLANKAQQKIQNGGTLSNYELGNLYQANIRAVDPEAESTAVNTDPDQHTPAEQAVIDEYQEAVDEDLVSFVEQAIEHKGENKGRYVLKPVSNRAAADIKALTGVDTTGYKTVMEQRMAEHIYNEHGPNGTTDQSMADLNDIGRIQYVLDHYDSMSHGGRAPSYTTVKENGMPGTAQTVRYEKAVNGTMYVVEAVPNTQAKTAFIVSAYMAKKQGAPNLQTADESTSAHTAKPENAVKGAPADTTIPQSGSGVNTEYAPNREYAVPTLPRGAEGTVTLPGGTNNQNEGGSYGIQEQRSGGERGQLPDRNGGRLSGTGAGKQAGELAGRGPRSAAEQSGNAIARQNRGGDLRAERVSSKALGLERGTEAATLTVLPEASWDAELRETADRIRQETEKKVTYVLGAIQIQSSNGRTRPARGVNKAEEIIIQADHMRLSVGQIADHEIFHDYVENDPGLMAAIERDITKRHGREAFTKLLNTYIQNLRGVIDLPENGDMQAYEAVMQEIRKEICADIYAGINAFGAHAEAYQDSAQRVLEGRGIIRQSRENGAAMDRRNGPGERYSQEDGEIPEARLPAVYGEEKTDAMDGGRDVLYNEQTKEGGADDGREMDHRELRGREQMADSGKRVAESKRNSGVSEKSGAQARVGLYARGSRQNVHTQDSEGRGLGEELAARIENTAVVDEGGRPLAVYHFTPNMEFETFAKGDIGFHFGTQTQAVQRGKDLKAENGRIIRAYLNIQNPVRTRLDIGSWKASHSGLYLWSEGILTDAEWAEIQSLDGRGYDTPGAKRLREILEAKGYDGIAYPNWVEGKGDSYIAFHDEQIIRAPKDSPETEEIPEAKLPAIYAEENGQGEAKAEPHEAKLPGGERYSIDDGEAEALTAEIERLQDIEYQKTLLEQGGMEALKKNEAAIKALQKRLDKLEGKTPEKPKQKEAKPAEESKPLIAKDDLKTQMMQLFSIPEEKRRELGAYTERLADKLLKRGKLTQADRDAFFDQMYEAGMMEVEAEESYQEGRRLVQERRIYVPEQVKAEFGEDWNAFRRRAFEAGLQLTDDGSDSGIDAVNAELAEAMPGLFDAGEPEERRMLEVFVQVAEEGKAEKMSLAEYTAMLAGREQVSEDAILDSMERQMDLALKSFAEKAALEVKLRDKEGVRQAQDRARRREMAQRERERRELQEMQKRTLKQLQWLSKNQKRAPGDLRAQFREVLGDIDIYAASAANEMRWSGKYQATWKDLAQMYKTAKESDPNFLPSKDLERIVMRLDGEKIDKLDIGALKDLYRAAVGLRTELYNRNNLLMDNERRAIAEVYAESTAELEKAGGKEKANRGTVKRFFDDEQLTPMNRLQRMAGWNPNSTWAGMAKQLEEGERAKRRFEVQAQAQLGDFLEENKEWAKTADGQGKDAVWYEFQVHPMLEWNMGDQPILSEGTVTVYMTPAQKVHMYLESKNYDNLRHMAGGRTFANKELYSKGKRAEAFAQGTTVKLSPETVKKLTSTLTPEEQGLANALERFYNGYARDEINRVSNILYGYDKAMEKNYAPIFTNQNYVKSEPGIFDVTAEGIGNLKSRVPSKNPSLNISAFDAFERNVKRTARFVGLAIPVRNWNSLLNWRSAAQNTSAAGALRVQMKSSGVSALAGQDSLAKTLASKIPEMQGMNTVSRLTGTEMNDRTKKASEQIRALFSKIGSVFRKGFGEVSFGEYGVGGMLNHRPLNRAKMVSLAAVPDVIKMGKIISDDPNWKGRGYRSVVFAAPVEIAGETVYVAAVVNQNPDGKFYMNECVDSEGNYIRIEEIAHPTTQRAGVTVQDGLTARPDGLSPETTIPQSGSGVNTEYAQNSGSSMRDVLSKSWGKSSVEFIDSLLSELQDGKESTSSSLDKLANAVLSRYISSVFGFNPSIVLKQAASFPLAATYLNWKHMPNIYKAQKTDSKLINTYTGELAYRLMGYATPETSQLKNNPGRLQEKGFLNFTFGGGSITWMDGATVKTLWRWAENKVRAEQGTLEVGTEEQIQKGESPFYKAVAKEFEEAVSRSQPMYDVMHRSNMMRADGLMVRAFTLFKTVPQQEYNMLRQTIGEARWHKENGSDRKTQRQANAKAGRAFTGILVGNLMLGAITFLSALATKRDKRYKDDKGEMTAESLIMGFLKQYIGDSAGILIGGDLLYEALGSILSGDKWYGIDAPGVGQLEDLIQSIVSAGQGIQKLTVDSINVLREGGSWTQYMADNSGVILSGIRSMAETLGTYLGGLPVENVEKYLLGLFKWISPEIAARYESLFDPTDKDDLKGMSGKVLEMSVQSILDDRCGGVEDSTAEALAALYEAGFTQTIPAEQQEKLSVNGETHTLSIAQQQSYKNIWSGTVQGQLDALVQSENFQNAENEVRADMIKKLYDYATEKTKAALFDGYELSAGAAAADEMIRAGMTPAEWAAWSGLSAGMKTAEKFELLEEQNYDDQTKEAIAGGMMGTEMETESGEASAYAKMQETLDSGLSIDDYLTLRAAGAVDRYLDYFYVTEDAETARDVALALDALKPEAGKKTVSEAQKWRAAIDTADGKKGQMLALRAVMQDSQFEKLAQCQDFDISPETFVQLKEALPRFDADGNGSYKQTEVEAAIDAIGGPEWSGIVLPGGESQTLSNAQRAALWQIWTGSKSAKNNPYSVSVGQQVLNARGAA